MIYSLITCKHYTEYKIYNKNTKTAKSYSTSSPRVKDNVLVGLVNFDLV